MEETNSPSKVSAIKDDVCFFTLVRSLEGLKHANFLIKCLRTFGGPLRASRFIVFITEPKVVFDQHHELDNVQIAPLEVAPELHSYWFGDKVAVCAAAEEMLDGNARSLIWMNSQCMIVNPPVLLDLSSASDAAFRPVHVQNIGLLSGQALDPFWSEIYGAVGLDETLRSVESFVDSQNLLPYFNTHIFSVNSSLALLRTWLEIFKTMVKDQKFQSGPCTDDYHKIFLHQAILSALLVKSFEWERICILPTEYSYPLHLHQKIPFDRQVSSLNELVCPVYEGNYQHPDTLNGLGVQGRLLSWIEKNKPDGVG